MANALVKNFVDRDTAQIIAHLNYCEPLTPDQILFVLKGSLEGPRCLKNQSNTMLKALLNHMGMHGLQVDLPLWRSISRPLESLLAGDLKDNLVAGYTREVWIETNRHALEPFIAHGIVESIEASISRKESLDGQALLKVLTTEIGRQMYNEEARDSAYLLFQVRRGKNQALSYNDWPADEIDAYHTESRADIKNMRAQGLVVNKKRKSDLPVYGELVLWRLASMGEEEMERIRNRAKRHAASTLQLERTAWEVMLYGAESGIEGERRTGQVPEYLIRAAKNSRKALREKWGG